MKNSLNKIFSTFLFVMLINLQGIAQDTSAPEMADVLRSNGKIYVVVGVLSIILLGIVIYLFALDRKLSAIEKKLNSK